ncbi:MAG: hypothetical protein JRG89_22145, partial [Deltaproteobacteria bacterium]|nr:hypothetical protein [Deltaproteobacteria bacterium]
MRHSLPRLRARLASGGFTVIELAIVVVILGLLGGLAGTRYLQYVEKARIATAIVEIASFGEAIAADRLFDNSPPPDSLEDAGLGAPIDPWGTPYRYLRIEGIFDVTRRSPNQSPLPHVAAG